MIVGQLCFFTPDAGGYTIQQSFPPHAFLHLASRLRRGWERVLPRGHQHQTHVLPCLGIEPRTPRFVPVALTDRGTTPEVRHVRVDESVRVAVRQAHRRKALGVASEARAAPYGVAQEEDVVGVDAGVVAGR